METQHPEAVAVAETRMPCPECGESIPVAARKCRFCGAQIVTPSVGRAAPLLEEPEEAKAARGKSVDGATKRCGYCGAQAPFEAAICNSCNKWFVTPRHIDVSPELVHKYGFKAAEERCFRADRILREWIWGGVVAGILVGVVTGGYGLLLAPCCWVYGSYKYRETRR